MAVAKLLHTAMRVTKKKGQFVVDDEPMRLSGRAAKEFVAQLTRGESSPEHARFLAECRAEFEASRARKT
jgi:hypothetical protein